MGLTDLPLTTGGESNAGKLGEALKSDDVHYSRVLYVARGELANSPVSGPSWKCCTTLWSGITVNTKGSAQFRSKRNDQTGNYFATVVRAASHHVAARADRVVELVRSVSGNVLLFSSGHFLRVLAARWTGIDMIGARSLMLTTASISVLVDENRLTQPAIRLWNDTHHLFAENKP